MLHYPSDSRKSAPSTSASVTLMSKVPFVSAHLPVPSLLPEGTNLAYTTRGGAAFCGDAALLLSGSGENGAEHGLSYLLGLRRAASGCRSITPVSRSPSSGPTARPPNVDHVNLRPRQVPSLNTRHR